MKFAVLSLASRALGQVFLSQGTVSKSDLVRAVTRTQSGRLAGRSPEEIANKLNSHMQSFGGASKHCDEHSIDELNQIVRGMFTSFADELQDIYTRNNDSRAKRFATLAEYEESWKPEQDDQTIRHAKCFEIGEMWSHHLSEASKKEHASAVPTLPVFDEKKADSKLYVKAASCQTGHSMVAGGDGSSTHQWPDWPEELHYKAKGHGAYPFWWGGGSDSGTADLEVWFSEKQGAEKFYHSSCTGQSSWLRGACVHLMIAPGASPTPSPSPTPTPAPTPTPTPTPPPVPTPTPSGSCTSCAADAAMQCPGMFGVACMNCMRWAQHADCGVPACLEETQRVCGAADSEVKFADTASPQAYLYTADESKCCISQPTGGGRGPSETLSAPQSNFWNTFSYKGEVDFNGVYYQGKAKHYVLSNVNEPVRDFWYFTDLDDKPVQQGEAGTGPTDQGYPSSIGHTIWHDFDQSSFDMSAIDSSVFAIPKACKTTTLSCAFP